MAGRPREFDRETALRKAKLVFWQRGYEGTSISDLVTALGIASARIYAAFGSKENLFREAVALYLSEEGAFADTAMHEPNTYLAIEKLLTNAVKTYTQQNQPRGCMVVLSLTNYSSENEEIMFWLANYRLARTASIIQRLKKGIESGDLPEKTDAQALGDYFATLLHGISIQARDGISREHLLAMVAIAMRTLMSLLPKIESSVENNRMSPSDLAVHNDWICTWLSTSQPTCGKAFPFPLEMPLILNDQTLWQTLRISLGGSKLRLVFSNRYGTQPLVLGDSDLSINGQPDLIRITFKGHTHTTIPAGEIIYSDEISLRIPSLSVINLRSYLPEPMHVDTFHWDARHFSLLETGNQTLKKNDQYSQKISSRLLLESVEIQPESTSKTICVIGDSMVDGNGVEMDTYHRWTDLLAERLVSKSVAVINAGQSGSRLLEDGIGISTLSRFERDVLNQYGTTTCIVQIGLNDLGLAGTALDPEGTIPTANQLVSAYRQLLHIAKEKNIRMVGVTLVPLRSHEEYGLESFYQPEKEAIRQQVNQWMRTSGEFDAIIDSDMRVRDPNCTQQLNVQYDSGDHLHLNDEGHQLIASSIPLEDILSY